MESISPHEVMILDEDDFSSLPSYHQLKEFLLQQSVVFYKLPQGKHAHFERARLLNLTFWDPTGGGDILLDDSLPGDVLCHAAWHRAVSNYLKVGHSAYGMFLGESIASAWDMFLLGYFVKHHPQAEFLQSQMPLMQDVFMENGGTKKQWQRILQDATNSPFQSFIHLQKFLYDMCVVLYEATSSSDAVNKLKNFEAHIYTPLLPHYALHSWVLFAKAYCDKSVDEPVIVSLLRKNLATCDNEEALLQLLNISMRET